MDAHHRPLSRCRTGRFLDTLLNGILVLVFPVIFLTEPAFAGSATYTCDVLGRLASASYGTGVATTYSHDAAGNRTSVAASEHSNKEKSNER